MGFKQKRAFSLLVAKIAAAVQIDPAALLQLINLELERISGEMPEAPHLRLLGLESELRNLMASETEIKRELNLKDNQIRDVSTRIAGVRRSITTRQAKLDQLESEIGDLYVKLEALNARVAVADKQRAELDYQRIMKSYRQRDGEASEKLLRLLLAFFTLAGVLIAIFLLWRRSP